MGWDAWISSHSLSIGLKNVPVVRARLMSSCLSAPATFQRNAGRRVVVSSRTRDGYHVSMYFESRRNSVPEMVPSCLPSGDLSCMETLTVTFAVVVLGPCGFSLVKRFGLLMIEWLTLLSISFNCAIRSLSFLKAASSSNCFCVHSASSCARVRCQENTTLESSAYLERSEAFADERLCLQKCLDCIVSFKVCQVESPKLGDSLGSSLQCDQGFVECAGKVV